nr:12323_t:CDS:2 [Entrophospora candida]
MSESRRQEIIRSGKYLPDEKGSKYHPGAFYISRPLSSSTQQPNDNNLVSTRKSSMGCVLNDDDVFMPKS